MAIIPFTVPANVTSRGNQFPGLDVQLAYKVHSEFLRSGRVPIVEVLNRQDWPGKRDEFFNGNFGAIEMARAAGYDLVLVGFVDNMTSLDQMSSYTKVIETETGMTIWYGRVTARTKRDQYDSLRAQLALPGIDIHPHRKPSLYPSFIIDKLAQCIVSNINDDYRVVPE
ncbi:MAG: hypothetical protein D6719_08545 [Candidatus Dadabacteria bacterium]|nr:MAG: hypothetical protein D6719_08545 [Candidatus Dadabacteria bacterium]